MSGQGGIAVRNMLPRIVALAALVAGGPARAADYSAPQWIPTPAYSWIVRFGVNYRLWAK
jgi:hypothetical protein